MSNSIAREHFVSFHSQPVELSAYSAGKPFKRFLLNLTSNTGLKPGENEKIYEVINASSDGSRLWI